MAQANSNAQREPSMEEILASIRRIIEDSDAASTEPENDQAHDAQTADVEAAASEESEETAPSEQSDDEQGSGETSLADVMRDIAAGSSDQPGDDDAEEDAAAEGMSEKADNYTAATTVDDDVADEDIDAADEEVQSFREELADDEPQIGGELDTDDNLESPDATDDAPMSALNLADIQAEVAKQSDLEDTEDAARALEDHADDEALVHNEPDSGDIGEDLTAALTEEHETEDDDSFGRAADVPEHVAQVVSATSAAAAVASSAVSASNVASGEQAATTRAPIISEQAGRQVAAAFDELSEAFSQNRHKSFDDMAEQMMRPMLQDWLDNNLPVLVERLVREEIDRVARGASR